MPHLLTRRKAKWVAQRNPDIVRGTPLAPSVSAEARYYTRLKSLIDRMTEEYESEVRALFDEKHAKEYFAEDATIASQARILTNKLTKKFDELFDLHAKSMAEQVANNADKASSSALHNSLSKLSGGLSLPTTSLRGPGMEVWRATITENVNLITSIKSDYLGKVNAAVNRSITTGRGLKDLVPFLEKQKNITTRRAKMIAYDQTRKAFNNLNKVRMQQSGLKKYEWLHTSGSAEPRELHISYSGKIFSFDEPPIIDENTGERGIPGQAINCRCQMIPVIDFEGDEDAE